MKIIDLIKLAKQNGEDPVEAILDYLREKDSRITRWEAERLVAYTLRSAGLPPSPRMSKPDVR